MTFVSLSVTQILNWKNRQITAGFCKKIGIRFSVKNQQKHQILENRPRKSPKPLEKFEKLHRETATAVENGSKSPFQRIEHARYGKLAENIYCFTWNDAAKASERRFSARHRKIPPFTQFSLRNCAVRRPAIYFGSINLDRNRQKRKKRKKGEVLLLGVALRCCS